MSTTPKEPTATRPPAGLRVALWRAVAMFRVAALLYAVALVATGFRDYAHPLGGWAVVAVMVTWTVCTIVAYGRTHGTWPLLIGDLVVTGGCLLATRWIVDPDGLAPGDSPLPTVWVGACVLAWAVVGGWRGGVAAALLLGAADYFVRGGGPNAISANVLLLLTGVAVGYASRITAQVEERMQRAVALEAANRERERLARRIHESVLQILAVVQRRGAELGGEAAALGRLAGEQEAALRAIVRGADPEVTGSADLGALLVRYASPTVSLAAPANPVALPAPVAAEVVAAVGSALDNVRRHCGESARAWVLVDDEQSVVTVTVRDDGPGIADGRLAEAAADGRLGIAQSICGRIRDLGGSVTITTAPGRGTEVEMRVPRA